MLPGSGSRPETTVTLRSAALEFWSPTSVTASSDEAGTGRSGRDLLLVERHGLQHAREISQCRDLRRREARAGVHPHVERRRSRLLRLRLAGLDGQALDGDLHRKDDGDAERHRDRSQRAAEGARTHGAHRQQPDLAHRSSLASLRDEDSGIRDRVGDLALMAQRHLIDDGAVTHHQDAIGVGGDTGVVGHEDRGLVLLTAEPGQQRHHLMTARPVEVAGRLVGEEERR